jgi:hypothetical protein
VGEVTGRGGGVPVFDAAELRRFTAEPAMRMFLADLLASFARLESGVRWVRSAWRGWPFASSGAANLGIASSPAGGHWGARPLATRACPATERKSSPWQPARARPQ